MRNNNKRVTNDDHAENEILVKITKLDTSPTGQ